MAKILRKDKEIEEQNPPSHSYYYLRMGFASLAMIVLLFTPFTNNLDEIKVTLNYILGPLLVCVYVFMAPRGYTHKIPRLALYAIISYIILAFISVIFARYKPLGLRQIGFHLSLLGFFLVMASTMVHKRHIHDAVWFYILIGFTTSLFGIFHYFGGFSWVYDNFIPPSEAYSPLANLIYTLKSTKDMLSTILNRDFFASFLVFLLPLAISGFIVTDSWNSKIFIAITAIMMWVCLTLGLSKDTFGALGFSLFVYALLYIKYARYKSIHIPFWGIWVTACILWFFTLFFFTWFEFKPILTSGFETSIINRRIMWEGGIKVFLDNIKNVIIGGGPGSYWTLFPIYRDPNYFLYNISNVTLSAHNIYITVLCENGLLGFTAYIVWIASVLYYSWIMILRCQDGEQRVYQLGVLTSLIGLLFTNFFSPNARWTVVAVNYWAIMGFGVGNYAFWKYGPLTQPKRKAIIRINPAYNFVFILSLLVFGVCSIYGIRYFISALHHNEGLKLMQVTESDVIPDKYKRQKLIEAIDEFNIAIRYNPAFLTHQYKLAHVYNQLSILAESPEEELQFQENSLKTYKELQHYANDYAEIHYNLGVIYDIVGKRKNLPEYLELSLKEMEEAARQSNKITVQYRLAQIYVEHDMLDKAIKVYERILKLPIQNTPDERDREEEMVKRTPRMLTELYLQVKDNAKAEKFMLELYQKDPGDEQIINKLVSLYNLEGPQDKAEKFLTTVLQTNLLHVFARVKLADLLEKRGDLEGAVSQLEFLNSLGLDQTSSLTKLINLYKKLNNPVKVEEMQKRLQQKSTSSPGAKPNTSQKEK